MKENILITELSKKLNMNTDSVEELINQSKKTWNPNKKLNSLIRVNFDMLSEELGAGLVKGYSVIVQDPNNKSWAYGYHLKQRREDGLTMDYHSVSKKAESQEEVTENKGFPWKTEVRPYIDPIASCWPVAGSDFIGFDQGQAEKMFQILYNDYYGYSASLIHLAPPDGDDSMNLDGQNLRHVCFKDQLGFCEEAGGSFWYSFNNFTDNDNNDIIQFSDIDIEIISAMIPGTMTFLN